MFNTSTYKIKHPGLQNQFEQQYHLLQLQFKTTLLELLYGFINDKLRPDINRMEYKRYTQYDRNGGEQKNKNTNYHHLDLCLPKKIEKKINEKKLRIYLLFWYCEWNM